MGARVRRRTSSQPSPTTGFAGAGLCLVGFMGAGKSSVGRVLAQQLNWEFEDLDERIEHREHRSVAEIFRDSGESEFRHAEQAALEEVVREFEAGAAKVVALGGGAFVQGENAALLRTARVRTVFLDAPVEELWHRCSEQARQAGAERPLLRSIDHFRELYEKRRPSYLRAVLSVETGNRAVDEIASEIAERLGLTKLESRAQEGEVE